MKILGWLVAIAGVFVLGPLWSGYVLSVLWGWFLVPAFHLPQISIALAIGISLVVNMLTAKSSSESVESGKDKGLSESFIRALAFACLYPLLALGIGAIVHAFV